MSRRHFTLHFPHHREQAIEFVRAAAVGTRVEFKGPRRSNDQNAKLWAMLSDVASQVKWHGLSLEPNDFKLMFLDALKREVRVVPNIDGNGFVNLGRSSSDLSVAEMSDMIELIYHFGAQHGVEWSEPQDSSPNAPGNAGEEEGAATPADEAAPSITPQDGPAPTLADSERALEAAAKNGMPALEEQWRATPREHQASLKAALDRRFKSTARGVDQGVPA
jgi:hypothetical protein